MEKLFTIEEVAELLHISEESVRRYLRDGEMGGVKLRKKWLIKESDLERFITTRSQPPKSAPAGGKGEGE